jgi:hypothetical protein
LLANETTLEQGASKTIDGKNHQPIDEREGLDPVAGPGLDQPGRRRRCQRGVADRRAVATVKACSNSLSHA